MKKQELKELRELLKPGIKEVILGIEKKVDGYGYCGLISDRETKKAVYKSFREVLGEYKK